MKLKFRQEVLNAKTDNLHGPIMLTRTLSSWVFVALSASIAVAILTYLILGSYTKKTTVSGFLEPSTGAIRLRSSSATAMLVEKRVKEGEFIKKGEILFVFADERRSVSEKNNLRIVDLKRKSFARQEENINEMVEAQRKIALQELEVLKIKKNSLKAALLQNSEEVELQRQRIESFNNTVQRYIALKDEGFISELALQEKEDQAKTQRAQLLSLQGQRNEILENIGSVESEISQAPIKSALKIAELEKTLASLTQEAAQEEAQDQFAVTAPVDGVVTAIVGEVGQVVGTDTVATLLPDNTELIAYMFAPSRAIGFVQPGQSILIRYQAFPYQKYGQQRGLVIEVSKNIIQPESLPKGLPLDSKEGMYRITAKINQQFLTSTAGKISLIPGMLFEADIQQEKRRIIDWLIEPVYGLANQL